LLEKLLCNKGCLKCSPFSIFYNVKTNPWLIDQIEPNAAAVVATFGTKAEAIVDVIRGKFNPTGKLPFTIPANKAAVDNEVGDIPGYEEDPSYVYKNKNGDKYGFDFGLNYK